MNDILSGILGKLDHLYANRPTPEKVHNSYEKTRLFLFYTVSILAFNAFLVFTALTFLSPILIQAADKSLFGLGALTYNVVSVFMMCHQLPMRSIFIFDIQQAVCARDMGIYLGMTAAALIFPKKTPDFMKTKKFFIITVIPIALDGITQTLLNLRESNNILRITTGFIFGFGVVIFLLTRIKRFNRPEFKQTLSSLKFIAVVGILTLIMLSLILSAGMLFGSAYLTKENAVILASAKEDSLVYYIPPRTPFSYYFYSNKNAYTDSILSDLGEMNWIESQIKVLTAETPMINETEVNLFGNMHALPLQHYYGIWVVVQPSVNASETESTVYTGKKGTYTYIDALTEEIIEKREH